MILNVKNEYNELKNVLLGPVEDKYKKQQQELINIFKKYNINIFMTDYCESTKYQMFVRDPFIVIDNKILLCNMKEEIRKNELKTINKLLTKINNDNIMKMDNDIYIEGGDIIIHNNILFVGQNGGRTNKKGVDYLIKFFSDKYQIITLNMINPDNYIPWVHLDCLFNPISSNTALVYENGFDEESLLLLKKYFDNIIYINKKEQSELAINVFSIGNNIVIMQKRHDSLIKKVMELGFNVEIINIYDSINEKGFTRCLTCPLERK